MKKTIAIIIMISVVLTALPALAVQKTPEKTLFQIAGDSIAETGKPKGPKPTHEMDFFRSMKKHLMSLDGASTRAKQLSLRGEK